MPKPAGDVEKKAMAADKAMMEKLQALKGDAFDSSYMASQLGDHDETLGKLMAGQKAFTQGESATLITEAAQSVAKHRGHAYAVLGKLGQSLTSGMGGAGTTGGTQGSMGTGGTTGSGSMGTGGTTGTGATGTGTGTGTTGGSTGTKGGGTQQH
jgi:putative membrane protein